MPEREIKFTAQERPEGDEITFEGRSRVARQRIDDAYSILFEQRRPPTEDDLAKARVLLDEADAELERLDRES